MSNSLQPHAVARQAPLLMGFPRQEYWSRLPFPSPGDLTHSGVEPKSSALADGFFSTEPPRKPRVQKQKPQYNKLLLHILQTDD